MPRPLRIEYPGALYHVMCRGHGERAFRERMIEHLRGGPVSEKAIPRGDDAGQRGELAELAARGAVGRGLGLLGIGEEDLGGMPKGHASKLLLAAYLKGRYSVGSGWISEALRMGTPAWREKAGPWCVPPRNCARPTPGLRRSWRRYELQIPRISG